MNRDRYFEDVEIILCHLEQITRGEDAAWCFSNMLCVLGRVIDVPTRRLTAEHRDRLVAALQSALETAWNLLPPHYARPQLALGINACRRALELWSRPPGHRRTAYRLDVSACMRIFRNQMHNLCLLEQIRERAQERTTQRQAIMRGLSVPTFEQMDLLEEPADLDLVTGATREGEYLWS